MVLIENKKHAASIDVDPQYSFTPLCPHDLPVPEGDKIVTALNQQAQFAHYRIGTKEAHPANPIWLANHKYPPFTPLFAPHADVYWPAHCIPGTKGFELIEGLPHPVDYDFFVWKGIEPDMHPYGSCYHDLKETLSTGLIEFLQTKQVSTVIVGGLATDHCVKNTVLQLLKAGFKTIVNLSACRGLAIESTKQAIHHMQEKGAIIIDSIQELPLHPLGK